MMSASCQLNEVFDFAKNVYAHKKRSHHVFKTLRKAHVIKIYLRLSRFLVNTLTQHICQELERSFYEEINDKE